MLLIRDVSRVWSSRRQSCQDLVVEQNVHETWHLNKTKLVVVSLPLCLSLLGSHCKTRVIHAQPHRQVTRKDGNSGVCNLGVIGITEEAN